jgi:Phage late-transcription coactivator
MRSNMASREEKNRFSMMIMEMAISERIDHMDAITTYCEKNNLEIEIAATLINESLKSIILSEAMELRYLPKEGKLPI